MMMLHRIGQRWRGANEVAIVAVTPARNDVRGGGGRWHDATPDGPREYEDRRDGEDRRGVALRPQRRLALLQPLATLPSHAGHDAPDETAQRGVLDERAARRRPAHRRLNIAVGVA